MTVKKKPVVFTASDGTEFDNENDALAYEELAVAKQVYADARSHLKRKLLGSQKTKDGEPFEFHKWNPYWVLRDYLGQKPYLESVDPWFHSIDIDDRCEASFLMSCRTQDNRVNYYESVVRSYKISELYYHKKNAEIALHEAYRAHIKELEDEMG